MKKISFFYPHSALNDEMHAELKALFCRDDFQLCIMIILRQNKKVICMRNEKKLIMMKIMLREVNFSRKLKKSTFFENNVINFSLFISFHKDSYLAYNCWTGGGTTEQEAAGNSSFGPESSAIQMLCGRPTLHSGAIGTHYHHQLNFGWKIFLKKLLKNGR